MLKIGRLELDTRGLVFIRLPHVGEACIVRDKIGSGWWIERDGRGQVAARLFGCSVALSPWRVVTGQRAGAAAHAA
jgi:hypothetical protein